MRGEYSTRQKREMMQYLSGHGMEHYTVDGFVEAMKEEGVAVGKTTGFGAIRDHAWTEVKIGKTWYVCDTNLDKYSGVDSLTYFLKKRSSLKKIYNKYKSVKTYTIKF